MFSSQNDRKLRIARSLWAGLFPLYIMEQQGFLPEGVEIIDVEDFEDTVEMLAAGELDGNFQPLADTVPMVSKGLDLRLILASDLAVGVDGFVASQEIKQVDDLLGKRVGVALLAYPHILLSQVLKKNNINELDLELVPIKGEQVPLALLNQQLDAGHSWGVHIKTACAQGAHLLFDSSEFPGLLVVSLVVRGDSLQQNKKQWQQFIRARDQALAWWKANHKESLDIISEGAGISKKEASEMLKGIKIYSEAESSLLFHKSSTQPPALYASGELFIKFFQMHNALDRQVNLSKILHPLNSDTV